MFGKGLSKFGPPEAASSVFINLTPMMDALTSLLFFLMANLAAQSIAIEGVEGIKLPASTADKELVLTLKIMASLDAIKLEDLPVVVLKNGLVDSKHLEEQKIIPLYNALVRMLEQKRVKGLELKVDSSVVLLIADRRLKTEVITKIMKTCGMAGIANFHFGVLRG